MMKSRVLAVLLTLSLVWASVITVLYWRLKNNPRVVAVTMETSQGNLQSQQLADIEKMTFLRQYLDRYFNFDSHNFWQSQTSLAFLMSPSLGESRIREVSRLREKIQQKNLSQLGQLRLLTQSTDGKFEAHVALQTTESSQQHRLSVITQLKLQGTERTLENPWGLLVQEMQFLSSSPQEEEVPTQLLLRPNSPSFLTLPCAIENFENPDEKNIKIKITTLNVSELQITPVAPVAGNLHILASCRDREFKISLIPAEKQQTLYAILPLTAGSPRVSDAAKGKPRKKDIYEKTIENVLGIQLDR